MKEKTALLNWSKMEVYIHLIIWVCVFSFPFLLRSDNPERNELTAERLLLILSYPFGFMMAFYFNAIVLVPKLVLKNKSLFYLMAVIACCIFFVLAHGWLHQLLIGDEFKGRHRHPGHFSPWVAFPYAFVFALSTALQLVKERTRIEKQKSELLNENLKTELSFLRSQVSPHFMFNVMNSIVALSRKKSDMLEPVVIKLSGLLRYMLYESDEDKVSVEKEVEYLQSYIDLQQLRFGSEVKVSFNCEVKDSHFYIEPMLLIPFVENAFKHGVVMVDNPEINITLSTERNTLFLKVSNRYNDAIKEEKDKSSGIGLTNAKRRLQLLYPNTHRLQIVHSENSFAVVLKIELND